MTMLVGESAEFTRSFDAADVTAYTDLCAHNPDSGAVPEPLVNGLFSYLLGMKLPGTGTNYLRQESHFMRTPKIGMPLTARVTITRLRPEKNLVDLETRCLDADGETVCRGHALVYVRDVQQ